MTLLMIDPDDGCMMGTRLPPLPDFIPPTIAKGLADGFGTEADFYIVDERPMALWPHWDYAEDWSVHPIKEIHPFIPAIYGKEVTESEFRKRVKAMHGLE